MRPKWRTMLRFTLIPVGLIALISILATGTGCGNTRKFYRVTSYPEGAVVYVDDKPRGQTDFEKLLVDYQNKSFVTLRLEKDGYQTNGVTLSETSPGEVMFYQDRAPQNDDILRQIGEVPDQKVFVMETD